VIHVSLDAATVRAVQFSAGSSSASTSSFDDRRRIFVIALSFTGAAALLPEVVGAVDQGFVAIEGSIWSELRARLLDAPSFAERAAVAEWFLEERTSAGTTGQSPFFRAADAIASDRWRGSVADLARAFGCEERTLRNRFRQDLGWAPKGLLRVARFNRALRTLHPGSWAGAPDTDSRIEFADEAHFHREFVAHAGISPRAFVEAKRRSGEPMLHSVVLD
jgi:AraC-like DNA-binding protein